MSYTPTFVTEPRPAWMPSSTISFPSTSSSQSRKDRASCHPHYAGCIPSSAASSASHHNLRPQPPLLPSPRSLPEHSQRSQSQNLVVSTYHDTVDQGEDSDYFHESTPGPAWKETKQAVPRARIVGFNIETQYNSKSGATVDPVPLQPKQSPSDILQTSSGSSRTSVPDRSNAFRQQQFPVPADKPRISQLTTCPTHRRRVKTCKPSIAHGSDLPVKVN